MPDIERICQCGATFRVSPGDERRLCMDCKLSEHDRPPGLRQGEPERLRGAYESPLSQGDL